MPTNIKTLYKPGEVGFFNADGSAKSKLENNAAETKLSDKPSAPTINEANSSKISIKSINEAFSDISARASLQVGQISTELNISLDSLKDERVDIKRQMEIVEQLKQSKERAIQTPDLELEQQLQSEFDQIQKSRDERRQRASTRNGNFGNIPVRLGNKELASFKVQPEELTGASPAATDLISQSGLTRAIRALSDEKKLIQLQISDTIEERKKLRAVSQELRNEVSSIKDGVIFGFNQAQEITDRISSQIKGGSVSIFEKAVLGNINEDAQSRIIQQLAQ